MFKKDIRKLVLQKRVLYTSNYVRDVSIKIKDNLFNHFDLEQVNIIHIYLQSKKWREINTFLLITEMLSVYKINVIVPVVNFETKTLQHKYYNGEKLHINKYGIPEPIEAKTFQDLDTVEIILIPLLAFDIQGHRVGYGGGYYDHFLPKCKQAKKIGLSIEEPVDLIKDINKFDHKLDFCVTPSRIYSFQENTTNYIAI